MPCNGNNCLNCKRNYKICDKCTAGYYTMLGVCNTKE